MADNPNRRKRMQTLSKAELKRMNEVEHEDFVLINVLPQQAFNEKHIRTSINIPHDQEGFARKVEEVAGSKNRKIVLYCASFDCPASSDAGAILEEQDFTRIYDYEGGTKDWFDQKQADAA
jgi:rhodanese-related sulfurtransferase